MRSITLAVCACLWAGTWMPAQAEVRVADIFGSGMVLQREQPVPVWGTAAADETVTVSFGGQKASAKADAQGKWKVSLPPMKANAAPQDFTVAGTGKTVVFTNVLIGDVWLCSGQSNMGLEVRKSFNVANDLATANYPGIRCFTVYGAPSTDQGYEINPAFERQRYALTPQDACRGSWQACTPANVANWSAVGYFFARDLHRRLGIPFGIIVASCGATAIEAWTSLDGLKAIPSYRERAESLEAIIKLYIAGTNNLARALEEQKANLAKKNKAWFEQLDAEEPGLKEKWMAPALDVSKWTAIDLPVTRTNNPLGERPACTWFRKDVAIPAEWVGKELELHLGIVDSVDESYVNGVRVGRTWFDTDRYWDISRVYPVPATAVASTNVSVTLRLVKLVYPMGLFGPATNMVLTLKDASGAATAVSLAGEWRLCKSQDLDAGRQPRPAALLDRIPGHYYGHPSVQYNGVLHPVIPYAIRGATWYQGEANAPFYVDYRTLMPGLITSWRREWGQGDFPFGIVALADYQAQQTKPVERGYYHLIREAQAMALSLTNVFLATAVGVGEGADIHPKRKQEVGRRLALAALGTVYGMKDLLFYGPMYKSMAIEGSKIRLQFDFARGLHAKGEPPVGFAIAGADRTFYFAKAKIEGESVVVWSDRVPKPVAVRYAWASNPVCNVHNAEDLPMLQFHTDDWDMSQLVIPDDDTLSLPTGWVPK